MNKQKAKGRNDKTKVLYEFFWSCRLCGSSSGYRMPIIQNIIDIDLKLCEKIRQCLQLEVHENDKMPPLICGLCADKLADFYDFFTLCHETDKRTRARLGFPLEAKKQENSTENSPSKTDNVKVTRGRDKIKEAQSKESKEKLEKPANRENLNLKSTASLPSKPFSPPQSRKKEDVRTRLKGLGKPGPASSKLKRAREKESNSKEVQNKKTKIQEVKTSGNKDMLKCDICGVLCRKGGSFAAHYKSHKVKPVNNRVLETPPRSKRTDSQARESINSQVHDIKSNIKKCEQCDATFSSGVGLSNHSRTHTKSNRAPSPVECEKCKEKLTPATVKAHKCKTRERTIGKCSFCEKQFSSKVSCLRHQATCKARIKVPAQQRNMKPVYVRTTRCDELLKNEVNGHYNVSAVRCPYGLAKSCLYPYKPRNPILKQNRMVDIRLDELPDNFDISETNDFIHWDSDSDHDTASLTKPRKLLSLSNICLKTIFSNKMLGKVPKRRKKNKPFDDDFSLNIDNIINNLGDDKNSPLDDWSDNVSDSILKNDYDSDRISFNGEFKDGDTNNGTYSNKNFNDDKGRNTNDVINYDKDNYENSNDGNARDGSTKNNDDLDKISSENDGLGENNQIVENKSTNDNNKSDSYHTCKSSRCRKLSTNQNILTITKEITEMSIDDTESSNNVQNTEKAIENVSTDNDEQTQSLNNVKTHKGANVCVDQDNSKITMSTKEILSTVNSKIELLEIQILTDNDDHDKKNNVNSKVDTISVVDNNLTSSSNNSTSQLNDSIVISQRRSNNVVTESDAQMGHSNENNGEGLKQSDRSYEDFITEINDRSAELSEEKNILKEVVLKEAHDPLSIDGIQNMNVVKNKTSELLNKIEENQSICSQSVRTSEEFVENSEHNNKMESCTAVGKNLHCPIYSNKDTTNDKIVENADNVIENLDKNPQNLSDGLENLEDLNIYGDIIDKVDPSNNTKPSNIHINKENVEKIEPDNVNKLNENGDFDMNDWEDISDGEIEKSTEDELLETKNNDSLDLDNISETDFTLDY
ncbi:unnamed protein product [Leptosia nina]|uniref:Uncharacterized protein n=1 Tax=Leptosia nina TaxID=320188 RepID=A0AAV1JZG6_9NEOP